MNTSSNRDCVVVLSVSNLTGYLNQAESTKLRIDYLSLLEKAANGRNVIAAFAVSQQDPFITNAKSEESRKKSHSFLYSLQALGWTPLEVEYNSRTRDINPVVMRVYNTVCDELLNEDGSHKYDLQNIDLVFISGSSQWDKVIEPFSQNGLSVEVLYPRTSTSSTLYSHYPFRDLTRFITESNIEVTNRKMALFTR